jgi:LacI family transcriptional regulator
MRQVSQDNCIVSLNNMPGAQISEGARRSNLGCTPAGMSRTLLPALVSGRSQIIGLVLIRSPHHIAEDGFLTQVLDGLLVEAHRYGLRLLIDIIEPEHQQEAYLNLVRSKHIDGIILSGPRFDDDALGALENEGIPLVLIGQLPGSNFCSVDIDNFAASHMAVEHLISLGHSHIACITNASPAYTASADRLAGYSQALIDAGLPYEKELVRFGDFSTGSGYQQMQDLFDSSANFTATFVASDEVAIGAKAAIRERNLRIPQDIAWLLRRSPASRYLVPPTTVSVPSRNCQSEALAHSFAS